MLRSWAHHIAAWLQRQGTPAARRRVHARRRIHGHRCGAAISQLEILEPRLLLTNLIAVHVNGNAIRLTELRGGSTSTADDLSVSYTSSQVVLTGTSGTSFKVGGQTLTTDTVKVTGPASITLRLNRHANVVTLTGDGTTSLSALNLKLGAGKQNASVTLSKVIADSVSVQGRRPNDSVTFNQCTVNGNLNVILGNSSGDLLDLESTTVNGNVRDRVGPLTMNQSTITGSLSNVEPGKNSTLTSTDSKYTGKVSIRMGPNGVIDLLGSTGGSNHFHSSVSVTGAPHHETTVNEYQGSTVFDVSPTYRNATVNTPTTTLATPTVNSQTITTTVAPLITGTYDAVNTVVLTVTANGKTYTLGTNPQLTSPSKGQWSLNLGGATLISPVTTVTVTSVGKSGNQASGSGSITDGTAIINSYLAANQLTATTTADGLNYVITTKGTGLTPTPGQTVTVNYSGFILNSNATQGTEFDSNTDPKFGHVSPFSFTLGAKQVIAGWDEAFALLPVGTVAQLIIPSALAYGTTGSGTTIPPNSILIFNVTLVSAV